MKKTIILSALVFLGLTLVNAQSATPVNATGMTKADANGTITMGSTAHTDAVSHKDGAACCMGKDAKCAHDKKECSKDSKKMSKKEDCCKKGAECCKNGGGACCKKDEASAAACCKKGEAACKGHEDADHHHAD